MSPHAPALSESAWNTLRECLRGELDLSRLAKMLYSQDASIYQETPLGVAYPRDADDIRTLVRFAAEHHLPLIPRAGGTSLAGQCVGAGLVVDVTRYMTRIRRVDPNARIAEVEPGVIQDDLNDAVAPYGLCFAPDTSTSRQAAIGGMIGNNSCGAFSILHGTTREHVIALDAVLADGSRVRFESLAADAELDARCRQEDWEGRIYREIRDMLHAHRAAILDDFPKPSVRRRNMGYALDELACRRPWNPRGEPFSLAPLLCGSEGTLAFVVGAVLRLVPRPRARRLICAHFADVISAARAVAPLLDLRPAAIELMDGLLLEATRRNREQARNRFWIVGEPGGVLAIEVHADNAREADARAASMVARLRAGGHGYAWPVLGEQELARVWALRKAGLGLLTGLPGDQKPLPGIEDAAVAVEDLPAYLTDMQALLDREECPCVFYGHASVGVIHLRPMLNLRDPADRDKFQRLLEQTAEIVRRYRGSLSGEHGDGRLRSALLSRMFRPETLRLFERVKNAFDPEGIFNPGKIVAPVSPMASLRLPRGDPPYPEATAFDWSRTLGMVRAAEACNGAGFCRQSAGRGGMCPTYMATGDEAFTTRARANVLRHLLTGPEPERAWTAPELWAVLDSCVACKACASECPSNVDMARLKAEALYQRHRLERPGFRDRLFAFYAVGGRLASLAPRLASRLANARWLKRAIGIAPERQLPPFTARPFSAWWRRRAPLLTGPRKGEVVLYVDEFIEYLEPQIGQAAAEFLDLAGWRVHAVGGASARPLISKGFLDRARRQMERTVRRLHEWAARGVPIIGLEPSAALGFRDEAPDLVSNAVRPAAAAVREALRLFPEWVAERLETGELNGLRFRPLNGSTMLIHGHCHQKALGRPGVLRAALKVIPGLELVELPTACCGMAGAFGYEREHYALSMRLGEQILFPAIRARPDALLCADGVSCRHQIADGTGRVARHSAEWLRAAVEMP